MYSRNHTFTPRKASTASFGLLVVCGGDGVRSGWSTVGHICVDVVWVSLYAQYIYLTRSIW